MPTDQPENKNQCSFPNCDCKYPYCEMGKQIGIVPLDFVVWYSGMSKAQINKAFKRWETETSLGKTTITNA